MAAVPHKRLMPLGAAGLAVFAAGVVVASLRLPEWRAGRIPPRSYFAKRFQAAAQAASVSASGSPRLRLVSIIDRESDLDRRDEAYLILGTNAPDWLTANGRGPFIEATGDARWAAASNGSGRFRMIFSLRGDPVAARWSPDTPLAGRGAAAPQQQQAFAAVFLPHDAVWRPEEAEALGNKVAVMGLPATDPPETIVVAAVPGSDLFVVRRVLGSAAEVRQRLRHADLVSLLTPRIPEIAVNGLVVIGCAALFLVLLARRRIDLKTGAILAVLSLAFSSVESLRHVGKWFQFFDLLSAGIGNALAIFVLWSASESWIRSTTRGFRTTLDALRAGRIGPQTGTALLGGWAAGAVVAGVWLLAFAGATWVRGVSPIDLSVHLPMFESKTSLFTEGVLQAGLVLLAIATARQAPVLRRIPYCGTFLAALFIAPRVPISSFGLELVVAVVSAALLVALHERFGLSALLTATVVSLTVPAAVYGALHFSWLSGSFLTTSALTLAPLAAGVVGLVRPSEIETADLSVPTFVRRLEEERRVQHEMDLLARMQLGLLPQNTPEIEGYEVAARSLLANEAGGDLYDFLTDDRDRLWIAAGDVSGHGYSCAIAQAMTKAGLASLIGADQTPAAVLARLDHVLRSSGSSRTFTSLALMRLDTSRGEALISNAGHPYPLFASDEEVREIAISSLPLGQGPARTYEDRSIHMDAGDVIIFCSDGLFEAVNGNDNPYGFERLRGVVGAARPRGAVEILDQILSDWRSHIGRSTPADDTTIVVLKRAGANVR